MGSKSLDFFFAFPRVRSHAIFSYRLTISKEWTRERNSVRRDWSVRVKAASDLFGLTSKKNPHTNQRKTFGDVFEGNI